MKRFNSHYFTIISIFTFSLFIVSCSKDDDSDDPAPAPPNEEEVITTLRYTLTPDTGDVVTFSFVDLDGDGGNDPVITVGDLELGRIYQGSMELLNESEDPAEDITAEIKDEDEEHQFFFEVADGSIATVAYGDVDGDGNPLGLESVLGTTAAGSTTIKITLRHEPDKNATGVSGGDITNAGGETDIEVTFDLVVQ